MTIKIPFPDNYVPNGTSLPIAGSGGPDARPPKPPLPPELVEAKIRVEREQSDRDFIKAASEMAEEARAFQAEQQKLTGYEARGAVARTDKFLTDMEKRYRNRYAGQCRTSRFQALFEQAYNEVRNTELRRAAQFEVAQRHAEKEDILAQDLDRRHREVREDPERLEEYLRNRTIFLTTQFKGQELDIRLKKDESSLISAAIQARVDMGDLGGAEYDLHLFKDQLAEADLGPAWDSVNRSLLHSIRTLPYTLRKAAIDKHFVAVLQAAEQPDEKMKDILAQRHTQTLQLMDKDYQCYRDDPMEYLTQEILAPLKEMAVSGRIDPKDRRAVIGAMCAIGLTLQSNIGGVPLRVLTNEAADKLHHDFHAASPADKVNLIRQWAPEYGDHLPLLLSEVRLPVGTGHTLAAEMAADRNNLSMALELMQAANAKESDFHLAGYELAVVREVVEREMDRTGIGRVLKGLSKFSEDPAILQTMTGFESLILKLTLGKIERGVAPAKAGGVSAKMIDQYFCTIADDDLGYVVFPPHLNSEIVRAGLMTAKDEIMKELETAGQATNQSVQWINIGSVFSLVTESTGKPRSLMNGAGATIRISPIEAFLLGFKMLGQSAPVKLPEVN